MLDLNFEMFVFLLFCSGIGKASGIPKFLGNPEVMKDNAGIQTL
jgi:hypothetical protein